MAGEGCSPAERSSRYCSLLEQPAACLAFCLTARDFSGMIRFSRHGLHLSRYKTRNAGRVHSLLLRKGLGGDLRKRWAPQCHWLLDASCIII